MDLRLPAWLRFDLPRRQPALLGIDIGSTAIRLIELARDGRYGAHGYRVESCALESLPRFQHREVKDADHVSIGEAIRKAVARSGSRTKVAAVAIPASATITKVVSLEAGLTDSELEARIEIDADQYIPYPLDEVNLDFTVLGPSVTTEEVDVLLAATRREIVDYYLAALEYAGLKASIVDVEPYALENASILCLGAQREGCTTAIADIGATATRILIVRGDRMIYSREQAFASTQLIEEVRRRYHLEVDVAWRRIIGGDLPEDFGGEVLLPFQEAMAQQIGRALQFFTSSTLSQPPDQILLAGGVAALAGFEEVITRRLRTRTYIANPFRAMSLGPRVDAQLLARHAPGFAVAIGLALRRFD